MNKEYYAIGILFPAETETKIKYVTGIDSCTKTASWEPNKEAHLFSKKYAKEVCLALCINGYAAIPILKEDYIKLVNPKLNDNERED